MAVVVADADVATACWRRGRSAHGSRGVHRGPHERQPLPLGGVPANWWVAAARMLLDDQRFVFFRGGVGDRREGLLPHPPEGQRRPPPPWRAVAATEARPPPSGQPPAEAGWAVVTCRSEKSRPSCAMRTCAAATRWMGRGGNVGSQRGRGGEEAVNSTGGRAAGWSDKIAGAPRRRRLRRRHGRGRGRHSLPCAGARRAHGRPLLTAASAAGAVVTPPAAVAAALTRRARVLRERTRPRRPQRIQRQHDPLFENSKATSPTGPAEPDSGQLPRNCDIMAVRCRVHLHPRPRKRQTCPHVPF